MLHNVKKEYIEDVVFMMKTMINAKDNQDRLKRQLDMDTEDPVDLSVCRELEILARPVLSPDGIPTKTADGRYVLQDYKVCGELALFIAFCLQEGELQLTGEFINDENRGRYLKRIPALEIDIVEWRNYIKDKYHILPPRMDSTDESLISLLQDGDIKITGGISCADYIKEVYGLSI
jgi:hypothetical protein